MAHTASVLLRLIFYLNCLLTMEVEMLGFPHPE